MGEKGLSVYIIEVLARLGPQRLEWPDENARLNDAARERRVMEAARALCAAYLEDDDDIGARVDDFERALDALRAENE